MHLIPLGRGRLVRRAYGLDEVALAPSPLQIDYGDVDLTVQLGHLTLPLPVLASAMDSVVDVKTAAELGKLGGLGVLNLEGLQTRYDDPTGPLEEITSASPEEAVEVIRRVYKEPLKEELVRKRIEEIKGEGVLAAVSVTPANAEWLGKVAIEAGADVIVVQSTVTTARFLSSKGLGLDLAKFCKDSPVPVIVGNCVTYEAAKELMMTGADAILVGVGPGAACTTRRVLGIGVPQATAIADCASAREEWFRESGRYVLVIADGGMRSGGDISKAIACGADAAMLGGPLAAAAEAPGRGYHWGMATPHPDLPRGTRIKVGIRGTLREILLGPAKSDDGMTNLMGALRVAMASCGARTIREMQKAEVVIAPAFEVEGKKEQREQGVGMGR